RSTRAPAPEAAREPAAPVAPTPPPPGAPRNAASPLRALSHDAPAPRDDGSPADRETPPGCDETPSAPAASPASPRPSSWRSFSLVSPGSPNILLQSKDALLQLQFILPQSPTDLQQRWRADACRPMWCRRVKRS